MILLFLNYDNAVDSSENEKPDNNLVILTKLGQILLIKEMWGKISIRSWRKLKGKKVSTLSVVEGQAKLSLALL